MNTHRIAQVIAALPLYQVRVAIADALGRLPQLGCWYHRTIERSLDVVMHGVRAMVACDDHAFGQYVSRTTDLERICPGIEMLLGALVTFISARVSKEVRQVKVSAQYLMAALHVKRSVLIQIHGLMADSKIDAERVVTIVVGGR